MAHNRDKFSGRRTFSQRYGYEPLPKPMRLEELSSDLRREVWNAVRELLFAKRQSSPFDGYYFDGSAARFIERIFGKLERKAEDKIDTEYSEVMRRAESVIVGGECNTTLDLVEIIVNDRDTTDNLADRMNDLFEGHTAAYWFDMSQQPYEFVPRASEEQGKQRKKRSRHSAWKAILTAHLPIYVKRLNTLMRSNMQIRLPTASMPSSPQRA